jgi:hypothetical protein
VVVLVEVAAVPVAELVPVVVVAVPVVEAGGPAELSGQECRRQPSNGRPITVPGAASALSLWHRR